MKMHKVEILIKDNKWKKELSDIESLFCSYFHTIFQTIEKFKQKKLEISILLTNTREMKILNKKFRKKIKIQMFCLFLITQNLFFHKKKFPMIFF